MKDDAFLIQAALGGDTSAFGQLVQKYQDRLFNTVLHVMGRREAAEDLVQDAFVQAYVKLNTFHGNSAFYTWLYRIAFNLAISQKRRKHVEASVDQRREEIGQEPVDRHEAPGERLLRQERAAQVQQALGKLSDEFRSIIVLREVEGCCYETIAEILDLPPGTVKSRLHRARLELRDHLQELLETV